MKFGDQLQACADCGDATILNHLSFYFARPLCASCYRLETQRSKRDAEVWLLDQMFSRSAA